ncbi:MAG: class I SAM-dependent methyltransferase [Rhodospirillaceae bacterium]|nr:class I SAM-dependent methyltransferase [Rhodospirillaceae bacterium]
MALHANRTRFAWMETPEERTRLEGLDARAGLAQALYRPLDTLPDAATVSLPDVLRGARQVMLETRARAAAFTAFTPVDDAVSRRVQAQYESFPYPPWDAIAEATPTTFDGFIKARFPALDTRASAPRILSAGCGTGRGAIMLALTFPDARITALDLSRASLAYAGLKAEQHSANSISFDVGDILNVGAIGMSFDLIESSGVLHHMADPAAGLKALAGVLAPRGLMRVGLYSERGRKAVIAARAVIAQHQLPDSAQGVREARRVLQALPPTHPARGVIDTPEFFSLDGLHDLIFNVQESRFTPLGLKNLLNSAGLTFLGFDIADARITAAFAQQFHSADAALDLDAWEAFEKNNADAFAEMYHLWCHKTA